MKIYDIPNFKTLKIENLLIDLNGTIQFSGKISPEVASKIRELKEVFNIVIISADTRGNLEELAKFLKVNYEKLPKNKSEREEKRDVIDKFDPEKTIAIGNGNNDDLMLENAALGIAIIGLEGTSIKAINAADIVFTSPIDALDALLDEKKIIATLRK